MAEPLKNLLFSLTPEDGASIGNGAMMKLIRKKVPDLKDEDYFAARDSLIHDGLVARGKGQGGSIMRTVENAEKAEEASEEISEDDCHQDVEDES